MHEADDALLDVRQAAAYLHLKPGTLARAISPVRDVPYYRIGRKTLYKASELRAFVAAQRRTRSPDGEDLGGTP